MQHAKKSLRKSQSDDSHNSQPHSYILEIEDEQVGLVTIEKRGCVFHAAIRQAWPLDRCVFKDTSDAQRAVSQLLRLKLTSGSLLPVGKK